MCANDSSDGCRRDWRGQPAGAQRCSIQLRLGGQLRRACKRAASLQDSIGGWISSTCLHAASHFIFIRAPRVARALQTSYATDQGHQEQRCYRRQTRRLFPGTPVRGISAALPSLHTSSSTSAAHPGGCPCCGDRMLRLPRASQRRHLDWPPGNPEAGLAFGRSMSHCPRSATQPQHRKSSRPG